MARDAAAIERFEPPPRAINHHALDQATAIVRRSVLA